MRDVTLITAYYCNPQMLLEQHKRIAYMGAEVKKHLHWIIIDDGSPTDRAIAVMSTENDPTPCPGLVPRRTPMLDLVNASIYRIGVDVRWNQDAARNIGAHHCETEWMLLTDIDHVVPEETWRHVITAGLDARTVYRFSRVDAPDLKPTLDAHGNFKPHPNTWLLTKKLYWEAGGYDERFAGWYGTDGDFRDRLMKHANRITVLKQHVIRYPREVISDASTTTYERKTPDDKKMIAQIKAERARQRAWRPLTLSFPYEQVA